MSTLCTHNLQGTVGKIGGTRFKKKKTTQTHTHLPHLLKRITKRQGLQLAFMS